MLQPNQDRLDAFSGKMVGDFGAIATGANVVLGDRLGFMARLFDMRWKYEQSTAAV
jgi:hypothetical protein